MLQALQRDDVSCCAAISACVRAVQWQASVVFSAVALMSLQHRVRLAVQAFKRKLAFLSQAGGFVLAGCLLVNAPSTASCFGLRCSDSCFQQTFCIMAFARIEGSHIDIHMLHLRTAVSFNAAMSACEKAKRWQTVLQLVWDMGSQSYSLQIYKKSCPQ